MSTLEPVQLVRGTAVVVPGDDIDTDRIIPARFLKVITFDALGPELFRDERYEEDGTPKDHPLNAAGAEAAKVLVTGQNFGSGSSREHAPQSIHKAGFEAIVAGSFAEIFFGNATTLGMACLTLDPEDLGLLQAQLASEPSTIVEVDVEQQEVRAGDRIYPGHVPEGARGALLSGRWDPLSDLLEAADDAVALATRLGYRTAEHSS